MKQLPHNPNQRQKLVIEAVGDYFGEANPEEKKSIRKIALCLMNRRKGIVLTDEEKEVKETIKQNLKDKTYLAELTENPSLAPLKLGLETQTSLITKNIYPQRG